MKIWNFLVVTVSLLVTLFVPVDLPASTGEEFVKDFEHYLNAAEMQSEETLEALLNSEEVELKTVEVQISQEHLAKELTAVR